MRRLAAVLLLVVAGCSAPATTGGQTPDSRPPVTVTTHRPSPAVIGVLNPAVTQATIDSTICVPGWAKSVRPKTSYTTRLKVTQLGGHYEGRTVVLPPGIRLADFEEDHLMPLELGGAPRDPANLRPVPIKRAKADQLWENRLHDQVCDHVLPLTKAQQKMTAIKRAR